MSKTSMTHATAKQKESAEQASPGTKIRLDIQALRAAAVAGVVLYHLWPHRLQGGFVGVDVFFVISGFLITKHLVSRPPRSFTDVFDFWARRIKRLLPASLLVLTATAVATYFVGAASAWQNTGKQIVSSAVYVQNWILASDSVDYLASENAPTAVQHFWSLCGGTVLFRLACSNWVAGRYRHQNQSPPLSCFAGGHRRHCTPVSGHLHLAVDPRSCKGILRHSDKDLGTRCGRARRHSVHEVSTQ